jgi:hypothetical protein
MLYALLEEHDPAVDEALRSAAIAPAEVRRQVRHALGTGDARTWEGVLLTPRVRNIIRLAEARAIDREIEPLDLYEAICEGGGLAAEILRSARNSAGAA